MAELRSKRTTDDMFILATDRDSIKPDASARKLIRRHVMKGKNRKAVPRRLRCGSWINHEHGDPALRPEVGNDCVAQTERSSRALSPLTQIDLNLFLLNMSVYKPPCTLEMMCRCGPPSPLLVLESQLADKTNRVTVLMVMQKTMYPPAIHATLIPRDNSWMEDLKSDPLYADTIIETSQTYFHVFQHRVLKPDALRHMNRALVHLQGKLGEASPVITDSIIFLVLALGMLMEELGDFETARKHIRGLHQLIKFRGGMKALGEKRALQIKCCR